MKARGISMEATDKICMRAGGTDFVVQRGQIGTTGDVHAVESHAVHIGCAKGIKAGTASPLSCGNIATPSRDNRDRLKPDDFPTERGFKGDESKYEQVDQSVITG